jgi:hypothetical protein
MLFTALTYAVPPGCISIPLLLPNIAFWLMSSPCVNETGGLVLEGLIKIAVLRYVIVFWVTVLLIQPLKEIPVPTNTRVKLELYGCG